jgi:hypothetical protein
MTIDDRLKTVNEALKIFAPNTKIHRGSRGGWTVEWTNHRDKTVRRRWAAHAGSHYPVWHQKWGHGGTCCAALTMLMRWLQDRPVYGISVWRYWTGPGILLGKPALVDLLLEGGWPTESTCVVCDQVIEGPRDWWSLNGVEGPICLHYQKCERGHLRYPDQNSNKPGGTYVSLRSNG